MSKSKHDLITDFLFEVNGQFHQPDYEMLEKFYDLIQKEYEEKLQKQNETLLKITCFYQPYNLTEILSRLVFATDYLLHVKNYDGHNHEELNQSINRAKEILQFLETRKAHFL